MNKGIEIFLGYSCHLKCSFCFQKDLRQQYPKFLEKTKVEKMIRDGYAQGKTFIVFSGGEATLDTNLYGYVSLSRELGYKDIRIHTNGLTFSQKEVLYKYIQCGMTGVILSIHGYGQVHDTIVKMQGAFDKVKQTLVHLYDVKKNYPDFTIDTNTVANKGNIKNIKKLFKFLSYFPITRAQLVQLYSLYLFSEDEKKALYVSYDGFRNILDDILSIPDINITLENFPFCKVNQNNWHHIEKRQKYNNDAYGNMGEGFEESDCTFLDSCNDCQYKMSCSGIPKDYLKIYPDEKFIL